MEIEDTWEGEDGVEDVYEDDESETVPCPQCGADVYEDAERCPSCGQYIVHSNPPHVWHNRPLWWVILGLLGMLAVIYALAFVPV